MRIVSRILAAVVLAAPLVSHATPLPTHVYKYDVSLKPNSGSKDFGWAVISMSSPINHTGQVTYTSQVLSVTFYIYHNGVLETFHDATPSSSSFQTLNGAFRNLTTGTTIGTGNSAMTLDTTGSYVFYYKALSGSPATYHNFSTSGKILNLQPAPEPGSVVLLATALLGGLGLYVSRRRLVRV